MSLASSGSNGVAVTGGLPVERQQFVQAVDAVTVYALQHVAKICVGFHTRKFARFDETEGNRRGVASTLGGCEQPRFAFMRISA